MAEASTARLLSVNVGLPRDVEWEGRTVHTGIWKEPVDGRRIVRRLNVDGDGQGDLAGHGGVNRAVFVYQIESYRYWQQFLGRDDFTYGQFGENFTVEGLADDDVCIGDRYRIGSALFEVSQPRVTCYRLGLRMNEPRMPALVVAHHRPGFYLRVIEEGEVGAGDAIERVERGPEAMTVADVDALLYLPGHAKSDLTRALRIPALTEGWQGSFRDLLAQAAPGGTTTQPAWSGMRPMRVAAIDRESSAVISVTLVPSDGEAGSAGAARAVPHSPTASRPRRRTAAAHLLALRHAELSQLPRQRETGTPRCGERVPARPVARRRSSSRWARPRGSFVLRAGDRPVVLISAGVGATPVLAMLHVLASAGSSRPVWWVHSARNGAEHTFKEEASRLLAQLPDAHHLVCYSQPDAVDSGFDHRGRLTNEVFEEAGVPIDADFYLCGPARFMDDITAALIARGRGDRADQHRGVRCGRADHAGRRRRAGAASASSGRRSGVGPADRVQSQQPVGRVGSDLREPARACRGVRRAGAVVVPNGGVSHVRDRAHQRRGRLQPRSTRTADDWDRADLLLAAF